MRFFSSFVNSNRTSFDTHRSQYVSIVKNRSSHPIKGNPCSWKIKCIVELICYEPWHNWGYLPSLSILNLHMRAWRICVRKHPESKATRSVNALVFLVWLRRLATFMIIYALHSNRLLRSGRNRFHGHFYFRETLCPPRFSICVENGIHDSVTTQDFIKTRGTVLR